jgi:N-acetyl sugar amidotransferase
MQFCKRCVMPDTRPGIGMDSEGVCSACRAYERRATVDWKQRYAELRELCDQHRGRNGKGQPDCMIAVSGGKDSHFQTHVLKEEMGMTPLLVTVEDNFPMTEAGIHNLKNLSEEFGCDIISMKPNIRVQKAVMRYTFEKYGKPTYIVDRYIYTYPLHMAVRFSTPLLVYGENVSYEYGGTQTEETWSARAQIENGVASGIPLSELEAAGVVGGAVPFFDPPEADALSQLQPMYLSYFLPWNSHRNYLMASKRGFHDLVHEWRRSHHIEDYDQVDSRGYLVHSWLKYPKFGHATATDYASRLIRYGLLGREKAMQLVREHDHRLDSLAVRDFCAFLGYREAEFWTIVDRLYNRELFAKDGYDGWVLKAPVWSGTP